jgi:hypothetical protein
MLASALRFAPNQQQLLGGSSFSSCELGGLPASTPAAAAGGGTSSAAAAAAGQGAGWGGCGSQLPGQLASSAQNMAADRPAAVPAPPPHILEQAQTLGVQLVGHLWGSNPQQRQHFGQCADQVLKDPSVLAKALVVRRPKYTTSKAGASSSSSAKSFTYEGCIIPAEGCSLLGQDLLEQLASGGDLSQEVWESFISRVDVLKNSGQLHVFNFRGDRSRSTQEQIVRWDLVAQAKPCLLYHTTFSLERVEGGQQQVRSSVTKRWEIGTGKEDLVLTQLAAVRVQYPDLGCWGTVPGLQELAMQPAAPARRAAQGAASGSVTVGGLISALQQSDI